MPRASLVFFYFGEQSYMNRLGQETVPVHKALTGYDKSVLLRHETAVGGLDLSAKDATAANIIDLPTKENLVKYLNQLGDEGYEIDLYIFSHGWVNKFRTSKGTYGDNTSVSGDYLRANVKPGRLRAVWGCNCWGSTLASTWLALGAKAVAGARYVGYYPTQFSNFIEAWKGGATFSKAVSGAITALVRTPVQAYILVDAATRKDEWGGCGFGQTVLGANECSERYFRTCWLGDDTQPGKSGREQMNYSSFMIISGDRGLLF
jgi:hypothetical protein